MIIGNYIANNSVVGEWSTSGGGLYFGNNSNSKLYNNIIYNNYTDQRGGGMHIFQSDIIIVNTIFYRNIAQFTGGAIHIENCNPVIINCLLWEDSAGGVYDELYLSESDVTVTYCDIKGGYTGIGNIDLAPLFRDPENGDYHLMATECGDPYDSPCIDMGKPSIIDSLLDCSWGLGTTRSDMGAYGGGEGMVDIDEQRKPLPQRFTLSQNYPNPFNASTNISYELSQQSHVTIDIYDLLGRHIINLQAGMKPAGFHQIIWDTSNVSSGIYFYKLQAGNYSEFKKMILIK